MRFQTSIDLLGLTFALTLAVVCGLIFGAAPAVHLARIDPHFPKEQLQLFLPLIKRDP